MEDKKTGAGKFGSVRPRKRAVSNIDSEDFTSSGKPFGAGSSRRSGDGTPRRSSEGHSEGSGRTERRTYGERRSGTERRTFGDRKPYDRERKPFDAERSEHSGRSYEGRRSSGPRKPYEGHEENSGRRSYGERRASGGGRQFEGRSENSERGGRGTNGGRRSFGDRKPYGRKPYEGRDNGSDRGERRTYGGRKPYERNAGQGDDNAAKRGMNAMLSKRPRLDNEYSDNDMVDIPVKDVVRLNKYIANSGICSRREADKYIEAGVVTVNGEVVTELGAKVNIHTDDVRFNGERLRGEEKVYIIMNKPKGYVTTSADPHADKTVLDLLTGCPARVFAVGRLDKNTTGVLMFTNDGEISEKLTHPSYDKKKIYQVTLDHDLRKDDYDKILGEGVVLEDGVEKADDLQYIDENDHRKLGIEIHSGKNRVVRRIFEALGYDVRALDRVYFAGLTKSGLKKGEWRFLTEGEVNILKMGAYK